MDKEFTVLEHLEELRRRIIVSLIFIILAAIGAFPFASRILAILKAPSSGLIDKLVFFSPPEAFSVYIKIAFFAGLVISMPVILYQVWAFISPAITPKIRKNCLLFLISSLGAFVSGILFGFFILVPAALKFLLGFAAGTLEPLISASSYISFVLGLVLASGFVFEMPVLSFILSRIGIIDHRLLRRAWKYAAVSIFIIAAIVTPTPDIFNMTILAIPMLFLYELSIWVSRFSGKRIAQ